MNDGMWTRSAERLVAAEPAAVRAAVTAVAARLWAGRATTVVDDGRVIVHAVGEVWVTWELAAATDHAGWTRLRLVHDEIDDDGGPAPELVVLLDLVGRELVEAIRP